LAYFDHLDVQNNYKKEFIQQQVKNYFIDVDGI